MNLRLIDSRKDSTDVTLAADDDKVILEDSVENVDAGDVKTEPDELQTPGQILSYLYCIKQPLMIFQ